MLNYAKNYASTIDIGMPTTAVPRTLMTQTIIFHQGLLHSSSNHLKVTVMLNGEKN